MAREDPQMKLRLPPELKVAVEEAAQRAGRSINAEVVYRLETTFKAESRADDLERYANSLRDSVEKMQASFKKLDERLARVPDLNLGSEPPGKSE